MAGRTVETFQVEDGPDKDKWKWRDVVKVEAAGEDDVVIETSTATYPNEAAAKRAAERKSQNRQSQFRPIGA